MPMPISNDGPSSRMHPQLLRHQKSLASGFASTSHSGWIPETSQSQATFTFPIQIQSTKTSAKSPNFTASNKTTMDVVRKKAKHMKTHPLLTPLVPPTPDVSFEQDADQRSFITSPTTIASFGCRDAMRGRHEKLEEIPSPPLPPITLDREPGNQSELVVGLWMDVLKKTNDAARIETFLAPQGGSFTFWEAERYKEYIQAMRRSLLAALPEELEGFEEVLLLLESLEDSQAGLYDFLQAEDALQLRETLEVNLGVLERLEKAITTALTPRPAPTEAGNEERKPLQEGNGSTKPTTRSESSDSTASTDSGVGILPVTPEQTPSELFSPTSFFFVEEKYKPSDAGCPTPRPRYIRRTRSSAAVLTSLPLVDSPKPDASIREGKADSPTKYRAPFWKRRSSAKSRPSVDSKGVDETRCTSHNIPATELDNLTRALRASREIKLLDLEHLPSPKVANKSSGADVKWDATGKVTEMSARAILHRLCMEHRHPPNINDDEYEVLLTDTIFSIFHLIWKPIEFATMLRDYYESAFDRSAVVGVAEKWIMEHWTPLDRDGEYGAITKLVCFLGKVLGDASFEGGSARVFAMLHRLKAYDSHERDYACHQPLREIPEGSLSFSIFDMTRNASIKYRESKNVSLSEFFDKKSMEVFGGQLTIRQWRLVHSVSPCQFVDFCIRRGVDRDVETDLEDAKDSMETLGRWVRMKVLKRSTPVKRAAVVGFFVRLARFLTSLCNFPGAFTIYDVLTGPDGIDFDKLPLTKAAITDSTWEGIQYLHNWLPKNSYMMSSQVLGKPSIPILGCCAEKFSILTRDNNMAFVSDNDGSTVVYNLEYLEALKKVVDAMADSKKHLYEYRLVKHFQEYLDIEFSRVPSSDELIADFNELKNVEKDSFGEDKSSPVSYF